MTNLVQVTKSIQNIIERYADERGYKNSIYFECKFMVQSASTMFVLMMKEGLYKTEPFKMVFPNEFLEACKEDDAVKMVCDLFKIVINRIASICEETQKLESDVTLKFESSSNNAK